MLQYEIRDNGPASKGFREALSRSIKKQCPYDRLSIRIGWSLELHIVLVLKLIGIFIAVSRNCVDPKYNTMGDVVSKAGEMKFLETGLILLLFFSGFDTHMRMERIFLKFISH